MPDKSKAAKKKPKDMVGNREFSTFAEARSAAIEGLVAGIEAAEAQLWALKRATRYEELSANGAAARQTPAAPDASDAG